MLRATKCTILALSFALATGAALCDECPSGTKRDEISHQGGKTVMCVDQQGKLHGTAITYNHSGNVIREDHWDHGEPVGVWREYHPNGQIATETSYKDGIKQVVRGHLLTCPDGTILKQGNTTSRGLPKSYCALPTGERHGPYAEWSTDGRRTVWGTFIEDREHGVWTMDVPTGPKTTQVVYVVFDHGDKVPDIAPEDLPPSCEAWGKMSSVARSGVLSTLALVISSELKGEPAQLNRNKPKMAVCFSRHAGKLQNIQDVKCGNETRFLKELQNSVLEIAKTCLMSGGAE